MARIKVLICEDSALMRKTLEKIVNSDIELEVIGLARDGKEAVEKAMTLRPDVITMDINMPVMDGLTALQLIVEKNIAPVIMVSSLTKEGALVTFEALELGAFDFVAKPGGTVSINIRAVEEDIIAKIKAAYKSKIVSKLRNSNRDLSKINIKYPQRGTTRKTDSKFGFKAVVIGISTGGPKTIFDVLPFLPADLNAAVFLVQHMPANFTSPFAERIDKNCKMRACESDGGMKIEPGKIYVAKGGYHMKIIEKTNKELLFRLPTKPETLFIPSVDIMMNSVLEVFGKETIGVLMTGMGYDGADAMVNITKAGGITIAESEETAIVFGMPKEAIDRGGAKIIAPAWDIANEIIKAVE